MAKTKVGTTIRVDAYGMIARAVEEGVLVGWNRAHKHTDNPEPDQIQECIKDAVLSDLCEFLHFDLIEE